MPAPSSGRPSLHVTRVTPHEELQTISERRAGVTTKRLQVGGETNATMPSNSCQVSSKGKFLVAMLCATAEPTHHLAGPQGAPLTKTRPYFGGRAVAEGRC